MPLLAEFVDDAEYGLVRSADQRCEILPAERQPNEPFGGLAEIFLQLEQGLCNAALYLHVTECRLGEVHSPLDLIDTSHLGR